MVFSINEQYDIYRSAFEVYKTDEENFVPYVPNSGESEEDLDKDSEDTSEEDDSSTNEEEEENKEGFTLHQGEIQEIYYYGNIFNSSHEHDYEDISNNGSISFPNVDKKRFYKGVRTCLREYVESHNTTTSYDDMVEVLLGFITEQRFSTSGVELQLAGMTKLLDKKYQFNFTQMKRSDIVKEIIKTAGLVPVVDFTGMPDDVIDYTNVSSSGDDEGSGGDATNAPSIAAMVKKAIKGKKGARAKAEAIYAAMVAHLVYQNYGCSQYPGDPEAAWKDGAVNCADSTNIGCVAYRKAGLKARAIHGPNHFWCEVNINGQWIASDVTGAEGAHCVRPLGKVYNGLTGSPCGDFASC